MNHEALFRSAYERLNPAQRDAVDTIEGPVMVIAGPGTGKTQILTLRIANILRITDVGPDGILALTFTEAGARAMKDRLHTYIGQAAYRVTISTFHEFAGSLIRQYPDAYTRAVGGRPATDLEKVRILESIIETEGIKTLRPHGNPAFYLKPIQKAISDMKREYITPDSLGLLIVREEEQLAQTPRLHEKGVHKGKVRSEYQKLEKDIAKNRELLFIYKAYDALLTREHLFDFDDMIYETVEALERNEDMLRDLQERYQYLLADEHQDVNGSQNRILELLASFHERPNIFVVGDEKQAIYRFQGASLENFLFFEEKFPHTKTIPLTTNYRSVQPILDLSHEIITEVESPAMELRVPLTATKKEKATIELREFSHEALEERRVVGIVEELIRAGVRASEIAIIVRSNKEVEAFAHLLRKEGIHASATADSDILYHPITREVQTLITAVLEPENDAALFALIHAPYWGMTPLQIIELLARRNMEERLSTLIMDTPIERVLQGARERMVYEAPHRVLEYMLRESGCLDFLMSRNPLEGGRVIRRIYDEIEALVRTHETTTLADVARMFTLRMEHSLPLTAPYIHTDTEAVQVMTAHKSKGLEFAHVFIPHLTDAKWGDTTRPQYFKIPLTKRVDDAAYDALDDERKLLYVAMTRAKNGLYLSFSRENVDGRALSLTPLMSDVGEGSVTCVPTGEDEATFDPVLPLRKSGEEPIVRTELLKQTLLERGLSATSLNNYLKSPWTYFYRNVLRIPEVQAVSAQFGTALHNTMRRVTAYHTETKKLPTMTAVKGYLETELMMLPLGVHEYARLHERGLEALTLYLEYMKPRLPALTKEEYRLEARIPTGDSEFPEILLTGQLDRLDFDEEGNLLRVVDYKSGKPKTRGYIEGTTKDSTGDYKRQLTFYALLLSLQDDERLHTRDGLLAFVEADEKGVIHEEAYTITDSEIKELKEEILRVTLEIAHGAFLHAPCDPEKSDYCHLVELLQKS